MVGEVAVDLAEQFRDLTAEGAQQLRRGHAGDAVAAVDDDLHGPRQLDVAGDAFDVLRHYVGVVEAAFAPGEIARFDASVQGLDVGAGQGGAADDHLQAVVVGRVVAAGEHDAGAGAQGVGGVIQHRGRYHAEVGDVAPGLAQATDQGLDELRPGQAAVARHVDVLLAARLGLGAQGAADPVHGVDGQRLVDDATDIVGLEDGGIDGGSGHGHVLW